MRSTRALGSMLLACGLVLVALAPSASAVPATGGQGRFGGAIDWVTWGANGDLLNLSAPVTRDSVTNFGGRQLRVRCTITNFVRAGGGAPALRAYRSGNWGGDALDELYNIGGAGGANTLVNGLSTSAQEVSFDFTCAATLDGAPYALEGLVFADAEQSGGVEFASGTIPTTATWRLIDRYRTPGCTSDAQVTRTINGANQTLRLDNPTSALCTAGPAAVAFADGATAGRITVRGGGTSAVALGAVLTLDHGDAPASYGDALHVVPYPFAGGVPATGTTALFAGNQLATTSQPVLRLGPSVDPEGSVFSANADGDDTNADGAFGPGDDESEAPPASLPLDRGEPFTVAGIACNDTGVVAGWIDFDGNGTFDADERSDTGTCTGGTASLDWTTANDTVVQARSYMRLRYAAAADAAGIAGPAGLALSGEVEDHVVAIDLPPDLTIAKSAPAVVEPSGRVTWTITVRNAGLGASAGSSVQDTIPAGISNVTTSTPGCSVGIGSVTCAVGPLAAGASTQITISGTAPPTTSTCFTNTATVTAARDRDTSNNAASATACTRPPLADVRIAKSASPTTVLLGNEVRYTLTVTNAGPDPAQAVQVADSPAPGVTPIAATPSQGSCAGAASCSLGTLGAGQTATIEIVARTTALGTQGNTAAVSTTTAETDPSNNTASATIVVEPQADLRLTKTASETTLTEGDDFTYTLTIRNAGPSTAVDAVVTDSVPAGVRVRSVSSSRGTCSDGDPVVCRLGDMAVDDRATITIHATATDAGTPVNSAIVASPTPDPDHGNNQDSTRLTTAARADLAIVKTASAQSVLLGESLTFVLAVRNAGPSRATGAVVTDRIPDGLRLDEATSSQGTCSGAPTVVCRLGALARGQEETIRLTVTARRAGAITNTASVTSETPDGDPANNVDDALVEVGTRADLAIGKTASVRTVVAGGTVIYGLVVTNRGPHDAANVTVTDPVPAGMRVVSATPAAGRCTVTGPRVVACALGDLANGASVAIRVQAVADRAATTRNVATVTSPTPDPEPANNQDETQVTSEKADLAIAKTATARKAARGGRVRYRLEVRNDGPSGARGVVVTDPIPDAVRVTRASATAGSCTVAVGAVVCELGDLAAGAAATVTVDARALRSGRVDNVASVTAEFPSDPDTSDNVDGARVSVAPGVARIAVAKRASRTAVPAGERVRYRIVVRNRGSRSAHAVRVCDRLPAGLALVSARGAALRGGRPCWTIRTLGPRTARTFRVTARVLNGRSRRLRNVARADGANTRAVRDRAGIRRVAGDVRDGGVTG